MNVTQLMVDGSTYGSIAMPDARCIEQYSRFCIA
jgi:hypothetical protein